MDVDTNQPLGTPTWIELAVPDLDAGLEFYRAVFGWSFRSGPEEYGGYTHFLLRDRPVAGIFQTAEPQPSAWTVSLATPDVDETVLRARQAGGTVVEEPVDVMAQGRAAQLRDAVDARFALWQGRDHVGCQVVNEPGSLGLEHHVRGRGHRRRGPAGGRRGRQQHGCRGVPLRPHGHDHGSVRRGVLGDHAAGGVIVSTLPSSAAASATAVSGCSAASRPTAART
jgi:predicted enzyme related to lactoylglutathione lyase